MIQMKRIMAILLSLLVVVGVGYALCGSLGCNGDSGGVQDEAVAGLRVEFPQLAGPTGNPAFELAVDLPDVPDEMTIYKVREPDVTPEALAEIGRKLGLEGEVTTSPLGRIYELSDEARSLSVWSESGAIEYARKDGVLFPQEPPNLPPKEEAAQIAIDFLDKLGLSLPGAAIHEPIGRVEMRCPREGPTGEVVYESYIVNWLVSFDCYIDGVPLRGATPTVWIGNNGDVVRMLRVWREAEPDRQVSIKSAEQALEELRDGKGSHNAPFDCEKVVLDRVYLAYWMEDRGVKQEYVVPVYVFEGEYVDDEGEAGDFCGYCNAL